MSTSSVPARVGVIGARGYVGESLLRLLAEHDRFELEMLGSRALAGRTLRETAGIDSDLTFQAPDPQRVARHEFDVLVLALPNGLAADYVAAIDSVHPNTCIVDLSADHRFDVDWVYGLPERNRNALRGARRIANPGCYATALQLAIEPLLDIVDGEPTGFGVSGYSGAGTTPSARNDPDRLEDNLLPYSLVGHLHEREVSEQLGRPVRFIPHVAEFFRGLSMTVSVDLALPLDAEAVQARFETRYAGDRLVAVTAEIPEIADVAGQPGAVVGGFAVPDDDQRVVIVSVLDNLNKGAATQALQNMNLACGFDEYRGLMPDA